MKRIFDIAFTIPGLIILAPLFVVLALCIKIDSPGPILYRQKRVGREGKPFEILKFRTMVADAESLGPALTMIDDPRITRCGHWLRQYKLDELPQLINVFKGEMSLVGPRPEVQKYVELYTPSQRAVLQLLPGITDPASIKYRDETRLLAKLVAQNPAHDPEHIYIYEIMPDKIRINLEYAAQQNCWTDAKIIMDTIFGR